MTRAKLMGGTMLDDRPRIPLYALGMTEQVIDEAQVARLQAQMTETHLREAARLLDAAFGYDEFGSLSSISAALGPLPFDDGVYRFGWPDDLRGNPYAEPSLFSGFDYTGFADRDRRRRGLRSDMIARVICPA